LPNRRLAPPQHSLRPSVEHDHSVKPWLVNDDPPPERGRWQSPEARHERDGQYECILCALLFQRLHPFLVEPDRNAGPAGLLQVYRFLFDSRDQAGGAPGRASGPVPPVPLPDDLELHRRLPERAEPGTGHRQDQGDDGASQCVRPAASGR